LFNRNVSGILIFLLLISTLTSTFSIQPAKPAYETSAATPLGIDWWSQFQHDLSRRGYSSSSAPDTANLLWQASENDIPYGSYTGVVTCNGRVIATDKSGWVIALDEETGARVWLTQYGTAGSPNYILATPSTDGNRVFVVTCKDGKLHALSFADGHELWAQTIGPGESGGSQPNYLSSPAISQSSNKVIVGGLGPVGGSGQATVWAFNLATGTLVWRYDENPANFYSSVAIDEASGRVYAINALALTGHARILCLSLSDGNLLFYYDFPSGAQLRTTPAIADGKVYVAGAQTNTKVYCFDLDLNVIWSRSYSITQIQGAIAVANGKIYTGQDCINATNGDLIWHISYSSGTGGEYASPTLADGKMFIENSNGFCCYNQQDGALIWSYSAVGAKYGTPAISNGKVFFTTDRQRGLYAFGSYSATITAHCNTEGADVSISIYKDGSPSGYYTPHTFSGLSGSHTFAVPIVDSNGHPFLQWSTGETSTAITVSSGGTYTAYYSGYSVTIKAHCDTEDVDVSVPITLDGSPTGFTTPHTFTGLGGTHIFAVPNTDPNNHSFKQWNTGQITTGISVSNPGGTYTAYYSAVPARIEAVEPYCMNGYIMLTWSNPKLGSYPDTTVTQFKIYKGINSNSPNYLRTVAWTELCIQDFAVSEGSTYYYWVTGVNSYGEGPLPIPAAITYSSTLLTFCPITVYSNPPYGGYLQWDDTRIFRCSQTIGAYSSGGSPGPFSMMFQTPSPGYTFVPGSWTATGSITIDGHTTPSICYITSLSGSATITGAFTQGFFDVYISPTTVAKHVGDSQDFYSNIVGGTPPYTYQWYLDGNPVPGATGNIWTFTPTSADTYNIYLQVTDSTGKISTSNIATAVFDAVITFIEKGLPSGVRWSITFNGQSQSSDSDTIIFYALSGVYDYVVTVPAGFDAFPGSGTINVDASNIQKIIIFNLNSSEISTAWNEITNSYSEGNPTDWPWAQGGVCYGMASTALMYFMHYTLGENSYPTFPSQSPNAISTSELKFPSENDKLNNVSLAITFNQLYLMQHYAPQRFMLPQWNNQQFVYLLGNLSVGYPVVLVLGYAFVPGHKNEWRHAVVAFGTKPELMPNGVPTGKVNISIYDPNFPQTTKVVCYDIVQQSFSYPSYEYNVLYVVSPPATQWWGMPNYFGIDSKNVPGYKIVIADKNNLVKVTAVTSGLEDYFERIGDSGSFVCGIPKSSGIQQGNIQVFAIPNEVGEIKIADPGASKSTIMISQVSNQSGQLVGYWYFLNATTTQSSLNFTVTPSASGLLISAGDNALNVSVTFVTTTILNYSISQTPSLQVNPGQTLNLTCPSASILMDVTASRSVVSQGYNPVINIKITNIDSYSEMYNVYVYANDTIIGTFANITLPNNSTTTLTLNWNTTGFTYGNYILNAFIEKASEKAIVSFNVKGYMVKVTILGDINGDGIVNVLDLTKVGIAFGSYPGHPKWDPLADLNNDNKVNVLDLSLVGVNFGKSASTP